MKTFKEHLKEGNVKSNANKYGAATTGTSTSNAVEDGSLGTANLKDPSVLKRVNAFVGAIADKEYLQPDAAMHQLAMRLETIGLRYTVPKIDGNNGKSVVEVSQFGGRYGKPSDNTTSGDGDIENGDGISHRKEGGLKLQVEYETLKTGMSKVYAKLV